MQHGAYVNVVSARTFKTVPLSYDYDVYVFHRPGMEQAERINKLKAAHKMYCSGSLSHNRDFDMVAGAFLHSFEQDPNLRLIVVGTLQLPESLSAHPNVFCHEAVDYWQMFRLMSRSCMVIAPLEESLFTRSKSNVKFLEACVSGCYPVASPIPDMERVGDAAITFCRDAAEFEAAFRNRASLYTPQAARENYAYLVKNCGSERFVREFVSMINIFAEA